MIFRQLKKACGNTHKSHRALGGVCGNTHKSRQALDDVCGNTHKSRRTLDDVCGNTHKSRRTLDDVCGNTHKSRRTTRRRLHSFSRIMADVKAAYSSFLFPSRIKRFSLFKYCLPGSRNKSRLSYKFPKCSQLNYYLCALELM
jgi:hypothetical protein